MPTTEIRETISIAPAKKTVEATGLCSNLALFPILDRGHAPSNIYEDVCAIIRPIFRGRLPGKLLAGVSEPLLGVAVNLDPSDKRGMVERLGPQRSGDGGLSDNGTQFRGNDAAIMQDTGLGVVSEMRDGPQFGPPRWTGRLVPFGG